ncbi:related to TAM domain methyltransferase [Cephalotrichum gorgonifer]|uniref:Related to TAM domain methyltransferase n=1 Tax=Cephalotrichum gorgonifer TaxID=2041049 RepID=A0AAE8N4M0_9PEZI|nr:related to TAM domain methyltransferase [Cephalotrichum gorgonifer]
MTGETPPPAAKGSDAPISPKSPKSPTNKSPSPKAGSPEASAGNPEVDDSDAGSIIASSTASLSASILEYRRIHDRTFHHEIGNANYWASNDDQQNESMDINDFADEHPNVEVIGTDISPIQSVWVPPNLKFEIDDCTLAWTYPPNSIDYVHIRYLIGSIGDWEAVFKQAYQAIAPGGWLESQEVSGVYESDDGTVKEMSALDQWGKILHNFGKTIGRSFTIYADGIQRKAMEAAGFVDIHEVNLKTPLGTWPSDPAQKEIGQYTRAVMESDMEGYVLYPATAIGWKP